MIMKIWAIAIIIFTAGWYITGANERGEIIWAEICADPPSNLRTACDEWAFSTSRSSAR